MQQAYPWGSGYVRDIMSTFGKLPDQSTYNRALDFRMREINEHAQIRESNTSLQAENDELRKQLHMATQRSEEYSKYLTDMQEHNKKYVAEYTRLINNRRVRTRGSDRDVSRAGSPSKVDRGGPRADAPRQASELDDARRHERRIDSERREELPREAVSEGSA